MSEKKEEVCCNPDHKEKEYEAKYKCEVCKSLVCEECASLSDYECPMCEPPKLQSLWLERK